MADADSTYIDITRASLRRLKPARAKYIKRDRELVGFAVRVYPTGKIGLFIEARIAGTGKQRRETVASLDLATLTDAEVKAARAAALRLLGEWKGGRDTVGAEESTGTLPSLQAVLDRYVAVRKLKASTVTEYQMFMDTHLAAWANRGKIGRAHV